jgi:glycosyltransferase involved in cell wall biosynthesis
MDRAQAVIANSTYEERILMEDFSSRKTVLTLPQGLPLKSLEAISWRPEYPDRILYVGSLRRYKKVDLIIKAFKILLEQEKEPIKLVIVGRGPEEQHLVKLVDELDLNDNVEWKSNLSRQDLLAEYSKARVFVLLSLFESFSRVVNEAVVIGVPTVAPRSGAFSGLVDEGLVEGLSSEDPKEIAETICQARMKPNKPISRKHFFLDINEYADRVLAIYNLIENEFGKRGNSSSS